jgi:ribonuclease P protein component
VKALTIETLKKRQDFIALRTGKKAVRGAFVLQARASEPEIGMRVGYTASKTIGNAVARNRAKRRLRAAVHEILPQMALPAHDIVLIARQSVLTIDFSVLCQDLQTALNQINRQ